MPYKDLEKRREYDRRYKRRRRAELRSSNPSQPLVRVYVCFKVPNLRLPGGVQFREPGLYVTDNPQEQAIIEGSPDFGRNIHPLVIDK